MKRFRKHIEQAFFAPGNLSYLSRQSIAFVKKYHDYQKVAKEYEQLFISLMYSEET